MLSKVKVQAKTVSEAIKKGLKELHMRRDQVDVKVLEQPKKGFLGFGSKPAVVELEKKRWATEEWDENIYMDVPKHNARRGRRGKHNNRRTGRKMMGRNRREGQAEREENTSRQPRVYTPKPNEPQLLPSEAIQHAVIPQELQAPMQQAKEHITQVLTHMGVTPSNVNVWWDERQQRILVTFDCDKPAIVIGKEGKTLEAIQYLCTLAVTRHFDKAISVVADTQNYWRKSEDKINADIEYGINQIKRGASVFRFRPMSAQQRRYIHRAVDGNPYVQTASEGEGKWRKVTFRPTQKALDEAHANVAPADFVPGVIGEDIPQETAPVAENATPANQTADSPVVTEMQGNTQRLATETVAQTVTHTVVEDNGHVVEEHSVVVTTQVTEPVKSETEPAVQPVAGQTLSTQDDNTK